jgi:methylated-DNA-[protein]-cysteine S-methyltransferase
MLKKSSKKPITSFQKKVIEIVRKIPKGKVVTYKDLAKAVGRPAAFRAVGNILNKYDASIIKIPCHRVIKSNKEIGGYRYGSEKKIALLKKEGVIIKNRRVVI